MFGAILGDIAGSRFEFTGNRVKPKELFTPTCFTTDDTYLTEAVAESLMSGYQSIEELKKMVLALTTPRSTATPMPVGEPASWVGCVN